MAQSGESDIPKVTQQQSREQNAGFQSPGPVPLVALFALAIASICILFTPVGSLPRGITVAKCLAGLEKRFIHRLSAKGAGWVG